MKARSLSIALLFAGLSAPTLAEDQAVPPWAGVPLDGLAALGVGAPALSYSAPDAAPLDVTSTWRAPLDAGGFAQLTVYPSAASAAAQFDLQARSAASRPQPALDAPGFDRAVGDGDGFLLALDRNAIVLVRARDAAPDQAADQAAALHDALVEQAPPGVWTPPEGASVRDPEIQWDLCGRPLGL